jgi:predicted nucleic acid-binding protein
VIGIDEVDPDKIPAEVSIAALTLAELSTGPQAAINELERMRRQDRIQRVEVETDVLSFESRCAHAYGQIWVAVAAVGRKARGGRAVDLLIAATALAYELPLYTLNPGDFRGLAALIEIVDVSN